MYLLKNSFLFVGIIIADAAMALGFLDPTLQGHIQKPVSTLRGSPWALFVLNRQMHLLYS